MSANGTLNPVVLVRVGTQVSGTVSKLHVDFNDRVYPGEVLVELDDALFRAQVQQSEANVANAQAALELAVANEARMRQLHRQALVSRQELDQAVRRRERRMQRFKSADRGHRLPPHTAPPQSRAAPHWASATVAA